jgi:hypothetical protein
MMNEDGVSVTTDGAEELSWTIWPAARRPWLAGSVVAFCVALSGAAMWSFGGAAYALVTLVVLSVALWSYLVPMRYTVGVERVGVSGLLYRRAEAWANIRACLDLGSTLALSRDSGLRRGRITRRSLLLPLPEDDAPVRQAIARHVAIAPPDPGRP